MIISAAPAGFSFVYLKRRGFCLIGWNFEDALG